MGQQTTLKRNYIISASEIGQYVYCSIAWFLQKHGYDPISPKLEVGKKAHIDLGQTIDHIQDELGISRWFALIGYLFLILAIIIIIYGVIL